MASAVPVISYSYPFLDDFLDTSTLFDYFMQFEDSVYNDHFVTPLRNNINRIQNYYETVIPIYTLDEFRSHFRMSRSTVEQLCSQLVLTGEIPTIHEHGRSPIESEKQLLMYIWYIATSETYRSISDRFGVTMSSTHRAVRRCTTAVVHIADQYICWPDEAKQAEIKNKFKAIKGLPGVIGAVDGTHISIRKPTNHPQSYLNRKKDYSIILQGVCDADMTFIDVFVGWPGSVHDARVYRNSPLEEKVSLLPIESHLLGDGAYPLTNGLITPYRDTGRLASEELKFNKVQSATRNKIECTFGMLKGKWRRLKYLDMLDIPCMVDLIFSCTVIHNFVIQREGTHLDDDFDDEDTLQPPNLDVPTRLAFQKRDMLKMSIQ